MSNPRAHRPAKWSAPRIRVLLRRLLVTAAFALAVLWLTEMLLLPAILRHQVLARLRAMGFASPSVVVDQVSLSSATLRDLDAGEALRARVIHVTYNVRDLLRGKVAQIAIDDALIQPQHWPARAPATRPAIASSAPSSAPFARLDVSRSAIRIPGATGPATIPFELQAFESGQQNIRGKLRASIEGFDLTANLTSDLALTQISADIDAQAQLSPLSGLITGAKPTLAGQVSLKAAGSINFAGPIRWDIPGCKFTASGVQYGSVLTNAAAEVDLQLHSDGQISTIEVLPSSQLSAERIALTEKWPSFAASLRPQPTQLAFAGRNWQVTTKGAIANIGDVQLAFGEGRLSLINRKVFGQIASSIDLDTLAKSKLLQGAFPPLANIVLGGRLELHFARAMEQGADRPSLSAHIHDGTIGSQQYQLQANGIEAAIAILDLTSPHTPPAQQVKLRYGQMGKWEVRDGTFQFTLKDLQTLAVERTQLGWAGGTLWTDPYELKFASPVIRTRVYGEELDLGKVIWVLAGEKAWADGKVRIDLPVTFLWPRMRFGDGIVAAAPGGVLHMDYVADELTRYLVAADPRFTTDPTYAKIGKRIEGALRNFEFQELEARFHRNQDQHLETLLQVQGKGKGGAGQGLNLNVRVSDVDWLLSRYLSLQRQTGQ